MVTLKRQFVVVGTVRVDYYISISSTIWCPCHKVNRLQDCSQRPCPLDLRLHLPEPGEAVGPLFL